jgi:UDP-GlcNAc:undecaprenyl-phosphate/decaprenyl-phosphate GlcNAc-1-phosphate transferase
MLDFVSLLQTILALPVCFLITKLIILVSRKIKFFDYPNPIVESHKAPTPYGGGIAIGTTIIFFLIFQVANFHLALDYILLLLPVIMVGILDDTLTFSPSTKLLFQIFSTIPFLLLHHESMIMILLFVLFMLYCQNAWNLIDIMDGLTAGISFFVFFAMGIILLPHIDLQFYSLLSFVISFSVLGFRFLNVTPAQIFLGETGSLLLGSLFAFIIVSVFLVNKITAVFLLFLGIIPFFELIFLLIIRTQKGIPFYRGSPDHFALRMQNNGFNINSINKKIILFSLFYSAMIIFASVMFGNVPVVLICASIGFIITIISFFYFRSLPARIMFK